MAFAWLIHICCGCAMELGIKAEVNINSAKCWHPKQSSKQSLHYNYSISIPLQLFILKWIISYNNIL